MNYLMTWTSKQSQHHDDHAGTDAVVSTLTAIP